MNYSSYTQIPFKAVFVKNIVVGVIKSVNKFFYAKFIGIIYFSKDKGNFGLLSAIHNTAKTGYC